MNRVTMMIIAVSLFAGLGLNLEQSAVQYLPGVIKTMAVSGLLPTALITIILNQILHEED